MGVFSKHFSFVPVGKGNDFNDPDHDAEINSFTIVTP